MTHRTLTARLCAILCAAAVLVASAGCATTTSATDDGRLKVVTTTGILADFVRGVGGDLVDVTSLIPLGADPHAYEPSLRNVRDVAYADVAFSNYLMLEQQSIVRMLDANLPPDAEHVPVAEAAARFGATVLPMVENRALDTTWLGLRVRGGNVTGGIPSTAKVTLGLTSHEGPGEAAVFVTQSFGAPQAYFTTRGGISDEDVVELPLDAHTHLSWAFTEPGIHTLGVAAYVHADGAPIGTPITRSTLTFAVGVNPVEAGPSRTVLDNVHADLTVDVATNKVLYQVDDEMQGRAGKNRRTTLTQHGDGHTTSGGHADHSHANSHDVAPEAAVVAVPTSTLTTVPANPAYSFIDRPGQPIYMLAQAVLGKHVHGEIDPHLWLDVANAAAYVDLIAHELSDIAPEHKQTFAARSAAYRKELLALDSEIRASLAAIPRERRQLITNHDSFAYLADAYDLTVAGFVTPNPATEPSVAERAKLSRTIADLGVPAVFLEPTSRTRSSTLEQVASDAGVRVCDILGDAFTKDRSTYVEMMRFNAESLVSCLGESS